ncbi:hypothetical protein [Streptomyces niveus]|uniref:hypothetical protein n=1 Tax=Streptomyces niveus TaxID=193462 RepID=UPI00343AFE4B
MFLAATDLMTKPGSLAIGPTFEIVLVPEMTARRAVSQLDRIEPSIVGCVFAVDGLWGFVFPDESNEPSWPQGTTYLRVGETVTVPPARWQYVERETGWVRRRGTHPFIPPLLLHQSVAAHHALVVS